MAIRTMASLAILAALMLAVGSVRAINSAGNGKYCTQTAALVHRACGLEADDSYLRTAAACINLVDDSAHQACLADAKTARKDAV